MYDRERILKQVEKLAGSQVLHSSESLCRLLRYLTRNALDHPGVPVKEYQIATEVFGRPADFDPQSDSAIRVQAGRLRSKLAEYYASEGADDPIIIELPKGTYILNFQVRSNNHDHEDNLPRLSEPERTSRSVLVLSTLSAVLAMALVVTLLQSRGSGDHFVLASGDQTIAPELKEFWKPFTSNPDEPWVIFSNAAFVGRPETGIRYYDPARDAPGKIWDHYTGVGEVLAVHGLDQVFEGLHRRVRVKRGSLLSLDDVKNNDLIFLGSPSENLTLKDIPNMKAFVFRRLESGERRGDLAIVNVAPQNNEAPEFLATRSGAPLTEDYAVIGYLRGTNPQRSVVILAGTTTFGTQAAAEFLSRPDEVRQLLRRLDSGNKPVPFEAVVHVKVTRGVPMQTELVALRKR